MYIFFFFALFLEKVLSYIDVDKKNAYGFSVMLHTYFITRLIFFLVFRLLGFGIYDQVIDFMIPLSIILFFININIILKYELYMKYKVKNVNTAVWVQLIISISFYLFSLNFLDLKKLLVISKAISPLNLITAIAPEPCGVESATIVSLSLSICIVAKIGGILVLNNVYFMVRFLILL